MVFSLLSKTPKVILEKLNRVLIALYGAKEICEKTALTVENRQLRYTILGLAQESKQYANELKSHLQILEGEISGMDSHAEMNYSGQSNKMDWEITSEKNKLDLCTHNEKMIVQAYSELLNEPHLYENIREMIRYQLRGLLQSFSKLKLLSTSI
ncbi:MAG: hypothetical protein C5B59_15235 [Bacteroidetes bacterium]|nr:MAG: hypothetical protein C5B59_15235 [Bacteroidota bacterium]